MLRQPRRLLSAGIAIVLGVAFVTAALLFGSSLNASVRQLAGREIGDAAAVITPPDDGNSSSASESVIDQSVIDAVNGAPGVQGTRALYRSYAVLTSSGAQAQIGVDNLPRLEDALEVRSSRPALYCAFCREYQYNPKFLIQFVWHLQWLVVSF